MKENWVYRRGDLYLANLGVPVGSKQGGVRPVVVLQNDVGNYYAPTITIAPLTSKIEKKRKQPTHFFLRKAKGLAKPSMVLAEQLDTCDKICVIRYLGRVSKGQMRGIDEAVRIQLGYYIPEQSEKKRQGKCRKDGEEGDGPVERGLQDHVPVGQGLVEDVQDRDFAQIGIGARPQAKLR